MRTYILRLQRRALAWLLARFGLAAFDAHQLALAQQAARDVLLFCTTSGFLRDGRYPGGRHAERKIRDKLLDLSYLTQKPWGTHG